MEDASTSSAAKRPRTSTHACIPDLPSDILAMITDLIYSETQVDGKHNPFVQECDIGTLAASCACAGHPFLTSLAEALFALLSPRLGEDLGDLTEKSTLPALKEKLKQWELSTTGTKPVLWARLLDEVEGDDEASSRPALVSRATKARLLAQKAARISKTRAEEVFGIHQSTIANSNLPVEEKMSQRYGLYRTYSVQDVKKLAIKRWGSYDRLLASRGDAKKREQEGSANAAARKQQVRDKLLARGVSATHADAFMGHFWWVHYLTWWRAAPVDDAAGSKAADKVEAHVWYVTQTAYNRHLAELRQIQANSGGYRKSKSMYKQDIDLEEQAYKLAMREFVEGQPSMAAMLATQGLPACLKPELQATWAKVHGRSK